MNQYILPGRDQWESLCRRPAAEAESLQRLVEEVFNAVKSQGDQALFAYEKKFDGAQLSTLKVTDEERQQAASKLDEDMKTAIRSAARNIEKFHRSQMIYTMPVETAEGVTCWQELRPIEKVGLYIPGGTAPLFSTVLMLAIPAVIAGSKEIVLCSPPDSLGNIHPAILYAAEVAGVKNIFKLGGIQAIAAMTLGTESVPEVYKLFGPGNQYVTAAKQYALNLGKAIDMPAGPSEVLVLADDSARAEFVASDLLSQAEHGTDSQVVFVTGSETMLLEVEKEVDKQLASLPRKDIAAKALENSKSVLLKDKQDIIDFINLYAPEHFIVSVVDEDFYLQNIQNAGSVFIGNYTPESAGDYASGTNHTLPTAGFAKIYSGLNMDAFTKKITFQKISPRGLKNIGKTIEIMAEAEGLEAHKNAVSLRLKSLL